MSNKAAPVPVNLDEFVHAFREWNFEYFERIFAEEFQFKNKGWPRLNKTMALKSLRAMKKISPGFRIEPVRYECNDKQIIIEHNDYIPLGNAFEIRFEVIGIFKLEASKVVFWEEKFSYAKATLRRISK